MTDEKLQKKSVKVYSKLTLDDIETVLNVHKTSHLIRAGFERLC